MFFYYISFCTNFGSIIKPEKMKYLFVAFTFVVLISSCTPEIIPGWQETPVKDEFGNNTGKTMLKVDGYNLSDGVNEAFLTYYILEDLISGGFKPIFTISINGGSSSESVTVKTPDNQEVEFDCYDGIIFNIDNESDNIERFIELMKYQELRLRQDNYSFTINASGFLVE